ncbi:receptor-type adenylate cyclase a-like protein [Leishmania major strain Friedlin]|uniref:adenylate cyclase n=1 Tax=Leishmania major TaxID=5664 RepID=Q4Q1A1_LEIMA|nr:receptor-type adenylate cyclase a-like protein [Leishmania major strain Friedlin]CAG9583854.1 receptor-type_adenylate_cyclase_a-like_protein [Leishmania major strain Friedlin]CAJ09280.1 receptor-type adenylate cyclase a-like protein [Leishmania major strain Friedlin]|eukprot:XP_001686897.1 receptor-type adenylate cyclase a-like protein [Leishmania major strain Friedlin]
MWQPPRLVMNRCKGSSTRPSVTPVLLLLLLVLCAPASAQGGSLRNSLDVECVLLQTTESSTVALNALDVTAQKASITCARKSLSSPLAWAPTDGSGSTLNVYMSALSDTLLSSVVAASSSTSCTLVTSISEGVLDTRRMSKNVYFTNADPATEMLALLSYVMINGAPPKIGFVYTRTDDEETSAGAAVYKEFVRRMDELAYTGTLVTYEAAEDYDSATFAAFSKKFESGVSVVFFFPSAGKGTNDMFAELLKSSREVKVLMPSWLIRTATSRYLVATKPKVPASSIIVSSTNPHPEDKNFEKSMGQFKKDYGNTKPTLASSSVDGIEAVAGWITARATVATLQYHTLWTESPTQKLYFDMLHKQHVYTIGGDIVLGAYGSSCNVGGRMVLLYSLRAMSSGETGAYYGLASVPGANLMLKSWECHAVDVTLSISKMVRAAYVKYHGIGENSNYMTTQMDNIVPAAMVSATFTEATIGPLDSLADTTWKAALDNSPTIAVFGAASVGVDKSPVEKVLVEPVFLQPTLYQNASNVVYLTATNEQQLGAVATWVAQSAVAPDVHAVLLNSGASATAMQSTLQRIMTHAGVTVESVKTLGVGEKLSSKDLPKSGLVLLTGIMQNDIYTLQKHIQNNQNARVILLFDEVTQWYRQIKQAFAASPSSGKRLVFVTNLPPWTPKKQDISRISAEFLATAIGPDYHSPASMRGFLAVRALSMLSYNAANPSTSALLDALYTQQVLQIKDLTLGPFKRTGCAYSTGSNQVECTGVLNGGAGGIYIWSYSDMEGGTNGPIAGPYVVNLFGYVDANDEGSSSSGKAHSSSSKSTIIASVVVCVIVMGVVVAAVIICVLCTRDSRDNRNAPKDENEHVTLIFTDIESSTALWATAPQAMSSAVALHHKLIRQLVIKYKCYEVKTIGDSFMIACKQPFAAVQLARDIQVALHQADWGSTAIDDAYELIGKPSGGTDPGECGSRPWSGLRVRAGVHYGLVEVRFDNVTKGYDYYGNVVNTAARTESVSCGGQVICTSSVVKALTEEEQGMVQFVALGPHQLRGVAEPIEMYELRTVPGRVFPSKGSDVSANPLASLTAGAEADAAPNGEEVDPMLTQEDTFAEVATGVEPVAEVLDVYFSAYTNNQKIKFLQKTCKCFCLPSPPRRMFASNDAYLNSLMLTVATRTSAVINFRHRKLENDTLRPAAESQANAPALELVAHRDAAAELRRHSSVFFSGVDSPVAGESKRRRSVVIDRPGASLSKHGNSDSTMMLVLDNGELLTLCSSAGQSCTEKLPEVREATKVYQNGAPSISGDEVTPCFEGGNGLLFRIIDKATKRWAFYNDTVDFVMHVYFSVGRTSAVKWGPSVAGKVTQAEETSRYEGELIVPPLSTEVLMTGRVNGYTMRYCAMPSSGGE